MKRLLVCAALAGCAAQAPVTDAPVAVLDGKPQRPYEVIERIEARGVPGAHVRLVREALADKARALGAEAVVAVEERKHFDGLPAPHDPRERPLIGEAYPGPLGAFERGAFPPAGSDVRSRGPYYVLEGLAIRYTD